MVPLELCGKCMQTTRFNAAMHAWQLTGAQLPRLRRHRRIILEDLDHRTGKDLASTCLTSPPPRQLVDSQSLTSRRSTTVGWETCPSLMLLWITASHFLCMICSTMLTSFQ